MKKKMLDPCRNIQILELIGLEIVVLGHTDPTLVGTRGMVLDETRSMFLVRTEDKDRRVAKKGALFEFMVRKPGGPGSIALRGDDLMFRPEDRTKKLERMRPLEQCRPTP